MRDTYPFKKVAGLAFSLAVTGLTLRADDKRTFINNSGQDWVLQVCPRPAALGYEKETGNMHIQELPSHSNSQVTAPVTTLGESNPNGTAILKKNSKYSVEFTKTNGKFFHFLSLSDYKGDSGQFSIDFGFKARLTGKDKVVLSMYGNDPYEGAVSINTEEDDERAVRLKINRDRIAPAEVHEFIFSFLNETNEKYHLGIVQDATTKGEARQPDGSLFWSGKYLPINGRNQQLVPLILKVKTDPDQAMDLKFNIFPESAPGPDGSVVLHLFRDKTTKIDQSYNNFFTGLKAEILLKDKAQGPAYELSIRGDGLRVLAIKKTKDKSDH